MKGKGKEGEGNERGNVPSFDDFAHEILQNNPSQKEGRPFISNIEEAEKKYGSVVWEIYGRSDYAYLLASRQEDPMVKKAAAERDQELRTRIGLHYERNKFDQFDFYRWISNLAQRLDIVHDPEILEKIKLRLKGFGLEALDSGDVAVAVRALHEAECLEDDAIIGKIKEELYKLKESEKDGDDKKFELAVREISYVYSNRIDSRNK